jgi:hypothetical protein
MASFIRYGLSGKFHVLAKMLKAVRARTDDKVALV